jgi:hypothetical protein
MNVISQKSTFLARVGMAFVATIGGICVTIFLTNKSRSSAPDRHESSTAPGLIAAEGGQINVSKGNADGRGAGNQVNTQENRIQKPDSGAATTKKTVLEPDPRREAFLSLIQKRSQP